MSERQKVYTAIGASAILHVLMVIFTIVWTWLHPLGSIAEPLPDLEQLEVTLMPSPMPEPIKVAAKPTPRPRIIRTLLDTDGLEKAETAPEKALFESDKNSRAGSELPATGNELLPGQEGKERPFTNFKTQNATLGENARLMPEPAPTGITEVQAPTVNRAMQTPQPVPSATPRPTPFFSPTPAATPTPVDSIALGKPTPVSTPQPTPAATTPKPVEVAKLMPTPVMRASEEAGYRPNLERRKIDSAIARKGPAGVDSTDSPRGRYHSQVGKSIGSGWLQLTRLNPDLQVGEVTVSFQIDSEGKIHNVRVAKNSSGELLAKISVQAVMAVKNFPPPPEDLAPFMNNGLYDIDYTFVIYNP